MARLGRPVPWAGSILWVLDGAMLVPGLGLVFLAPLLLPVSLLLTLFLLLRGQWAAIMPALPMGIGIGIALVGAFVINSPSTQRVSLVLAGVALAVAASALPAVRRRIRRPTTSAPSRWSS